MSDGYAVVQTTHGAAAMLDRATGEVMHPVAGPLLEAEQLYVGGSDLVRRLSAPAQTSLVVYDVGLGAGSNAVAAWRASEELSAAARQLTLVSFDRTLEPLALALAPDHAASFGFDAPARAAGHALMQHHAHDTPRTQWRLRLGDLRAALAAEPEHRADIVFWDPFSPRADPSLWSVATFRTLFDRCRLGATLHTYSAATATRSALLLAGFAVGFGPAAPGRQPQTTVAATHHEQLEDPLDHRWLARLSRSSAAFPADAPADALARIEHLPQFQ